MKKEYVDIISNEYLLECDKNRTWEELHKRDRSIYLQGLASGKIQESSNNQSIYALWLTHRLSTTAETPDLGKHIYDAARYTSYLLLFLAGLFGIVVMTSFLYYTGQNAVNVLSFFLSFVVLQWCLLLLSFICQKQLLQPPWFFLIKGTINYLYHKLSIQKTSHKREELHSLLGTLWQKSDFLMLLKSYAFGLQQKIGIAFNLTLLFTLLLRIIGTDLAFGWQSTLHITSESLLRMVQVLSTPWSWLGISSPTIEQIIGSKIILKDGIIDLLQNDLASWWPFLTMSLVSYALIPRCLILVYALRKESSAVNEFIGNKRAYKNILQRMQSPVVEAHNGATEKSQISPIKELPTHFSKPTPLTNQALLLVPYDIFPLEPNTLQQWLKSEGYSLDKQITFMKSYSEDEKLLSTLNGSKERDIIIFMEAHMPALCEFLSFVQRLQERTETDIHISLIEITEATFIKTRSQRDFQIWNQKINALGNRHLRVIPHSFEEKQ